MNLTFLFRHRVLLDPQGPLCQDWEANLAGIPWDGCTHGSCWAVVTGGRQ